MRLHGFLAVNSAFAILTITASALPKTTFTSTAPTTTALPTTPTSQSITSELLLHRYYGRQASPDTSSSETTTPTAEYAGSESSKEDCDCAEGHSSINGSPALSSRALTATFVPSLTTSSAAAPAYLYSSLASNVPASASQPSTQAPQIQPTPQSQYYGMPATTLIQLDQPPAGSPVTAPVAPTNLPTALPGDPAIPSTITPIAPDLIITPAASLPTQDIEALISRGGQPWYQVTYYECVTWPSEYVHCGWHTPLRMGRNPDPEGETFVYGAAVRMNDRIGRVVGMVGAVLMLTL